MKATQALSGDQVSPRSCRLPSNIGSEVPLRVSTTAYAATDGLT